MLPTMLRDSGEERRAYVGEALQCSVTFTDFRGGEFDRCEWAKVFTC